MHSGSPQAFARYERAFSAIARFISRIIASARSPTAGRAARTYRVMAIAPGLAPTTMRVTAACVTTGQRRTMDFFLANRLEVREEPA
jgi:hypothetical protein